MTVQETQNSILGVIKAVMTEGALIYLYLSRRIIIWLNQPNLNETSLR
jgi:hypothetical protein